MAFIPDDVYPSFQLVTTELRRANIPFSIGGGAAFSTYVNHWRSTKDIDVYVVPEDRERAIQVLTHLGLKDYHETLPYDRAWIYRSYNETTIVDVIWAMANHSRQVDRPWVERGPVVSFGDLNVRLIPAEELIFGKMYVLQRDRCDWPDILNLLHAKGPELDWERLMELMGGDWPLLRGVLSIFCWLSPEGAAELPRWVLERFGLGPQAGNVPARARADLLDRRPWYVSTFLRQVA